MMASDDDQRRERHDQRQRPTDEVDADMDLREMTQAVAQVARHAGRHALQEQVNPHDLSLDVRLAVDKFTDGILPMNQYHICLTSLYKKIRSSVPLVRSLNKSKAFCGTW